MKIKKKKEISEEIRKVKEGKWNIHTWANAREGVGVSNNRPEVEAIDGPKKRKKCETEFVESSSVLHRFFLRQT